MSLTADGAQLLDKATQIMAMHREFIEQARRIRGRLSGRVRVGAIRNPSARRAQARGEAKLLGPPLHHITLLFACLRERRQDPLIHALTAAARAIAADGD